MSPARIWIFVYSTCNLNLCLKTSQGSSCGYEIPSINFCIKPHVLSTKLNIFAAVLSSFPTYGNKSSILPLEGFSAFGTLMQHQWTLRCSKWKSSSCSRLAKNRIECKISRALVKWRDSCGIREWEFSISAWDINKSMRLVKSKKDK